MKSSYRLALRDEGKFWNAYVAEVGTMDGARLIGSLLMDIARIPAHKEAFISLMKAALTSILEMSGAEVGGLDGRRRARARARREGPSGTGRCDWKGDGR
jgi:hypothetical protein